MTAAPLAAPHRTVQEVLDASRRLIDPGVRAALDRLDGANRLVAAYHRGLVAADGSPVDGSGGKGIRGALALLSARAAGAPAETAIPAAVACELVHDFSLLHDDIMDGDTTRRFRPTAWTVFGTPAAILAGDALLSLANEVLAEADSPTVTWAVRCLGAATRRLIAGQAADLDFESSPSVTMEQCREMAAGKTGALLACSASLGAILADGPSSVAAALADFGHHLGMAFQLTDDLLGIWGEPHRTGKPVWSDLRARKKSLPVVAALASGTDAAQRLADIYDSAEPLDGVRLAAAAAAVESAGGRGWAVAEAERETAQALSVLDGLSLDAEVHHDLVALTEMLCGRDH